MISSGLKKGSDVIKRGFGSIDKTLSKIDKSTGGFAGRIVERSPLASLSTGYKDVRALALAGSNVMSKTSEALGGSKNYQQIFNKLGVGDEYKKSTKLLEIGQRTKTDIMLGKYKDAVQNVQKGYNLGKDVAQSINKKYG